MSTANGPVGMHMPAPLQWFSRSYLPIYALRVAFLAPTVFSVTAEAMLERSLSHTRPGVIILALGEWGEGGEGATRNKIKSGFHEFFMLSGSHSSRHLLGLPLAVCAQEREPEKISLLTTQSALLRGRRREVT